MCTKELCRFKGEEGERDEKGCERSGVCVEGKPNGAEEEAEKKRDGGKEHLAAPRGVFSDGQIDERKEQEAQNVASRGREQCSDAAERKERKTAEPESEVEHRGAEPLHVSEEKERKQHRKGL